MTYTDKQLRYATEIAYFDLHRAYEHRAANARSELTVVEAIEILLKIDSPNLSESEVKRYQDVINYLNTTGSNWTISYIGNDNIGKSLPWGKEYI